MFLEWALQLGIPVNAVGKGEKPTVVFDSGELPLSISSQVDIGHAVAHAIKHREDDRIKNKILLMHTAVASQNEMLGYAKELAPHKPWPVIHVDTAEAARKSQERLEMGDTGVENMRGFLTRAYGQGLAFFQHPDNETLGIEVKGKQFLQGVIAEYLDGRKGPEW
jgi:hypothetical protein